MAKKKVRLRREPSASDVADLGTKHSTKERFEALRRMADIVQAGDRNIVKYVKTIGFDEKEALGLVRVKSSLMGASLVAMTFGLIWMYRTMYARRRIPLRSAGTQTNTVRLESGQSKEFSEIVSD